MDSGEFLDYRHTRLATLAREYHERCEAYDRTVCTGGTDKRGFVRPAGRRELGLIYVHATNVWNETMLQGKALGFTAAEVKLAIRKADQPCG